MSQGTPRIKPPRNEKFEKPLDRGDLLNLGLPIDHFYRRFVEIGRSQCPRCGHHHLAITKKNQNRRQGWEWYCYGCSQRWREPQITVGLVHRDSNPFKNQEDHNIVITEYKY